MLALGWHGIAAAEAAGVSAAPCTATDAVVGTPRLTVTVLGARQIAGNITFTLYGPDPAAFLARRGSIALTRVPLSTTEAQACFAVSEPGIYAVAVYHDKNNNHHFDKTLLGLPAEAYGFSNDAPVYLAPPSFKAARFRVHSGENRITIKLRH